MSHGERHCTRYKLKKTIRERGISPVSKAIQEFNNGQMVKVTTEAGEETIELQVTNSTRPGYIMIPHGFGLVFQGKKYGANANRLAKNTHRDRIAGTPYHRYIRCRVEAV